MFCARRPWPVNLLIEWLNAKPVCRQAVKFFSAAPAFQNSSNARLPCLESRLWKIIHAANASLQFCPVNWPLDWVKSGLNRGLAVKEYHER